MANLETNDVNQWRASFAVFDPMLNDWRSSDSGWFSAGAAWLKTNKGVVMWEGRTTLGSLTTTTLGFGVYDPALQAWQTTNMGTFVTASSKAYTEDGVVVWQETSGFQARFAASTYDPVLKQWVTSKSDWLNAALEFSCFRNIATFHEGYSFNWYAQFWMFDPLRHEWRTGRFGPYTSSTWMIGVEEGSGRIYVGGQNYLKGYDYVSGTWMDGPTVPLALFHASRSSGYAPLNVWFTDLSLGAGHWSWSFGDGSAESIKPSPGHSFVTPGSNTVTLTMWGLSGGASTNAMIVALSLPQLSVTGISNGLCRLELVAPAGTVHALETSADLKTWNHALWLTNDSGVLRTEHSLTLPAAFYRTRQPLP